MDEPIAALVAQPQPERLKLAEVVARAQTIRAVMEALMQEGVHYGKIPGVKKMSLWQPGAEKLLVAFQFAPDVAEVTDLSSADRVHYRVTLKIRHVPTGAIVGLGVGEASSDEEKYRWRKAVCKEEWEETPADRRRRKWRNGDRGPYQEAQVRTEPADVANTILKMAKKRALVDGAKSSTGASDIFDQDLEDLPEELRQEGEQAGGERKVGTPKAKVVTEPEAASSTAATEAPPQSAVSIPDEAWHEIRAKLHTKGYISVKQQGRLFALAAANGWTIPSVVAAIKAGLGIGTRLLKDDSGKDAEVLNLSWGDAYDKTVALFQAFAPASFPGEGS